MKIKVSCECKDFLALGELTEFQGGLKSRTEFDVDKIVRSIRKYGIAFPLFVWRHDGVNHCLDGHGRLLALKKMREDGDTIPPLPVVYVDCKDEQAARDLLLRLNSQYGRMTADSVREFADGFDVDFTELQLPCGVIDFDVAGVQETEGDDEVPDVDEKEPVISQPGEMYELGNSILMCGDSTSAEDVARLTDNKKVKLVLTDPPYGIDVVQGKSTGGSKPATFGTVGGKKVCKVHTYEKIIGDETTDTAEKSYKIYKELSDNQIIFGGNYFTDFLNASRCWLVWDKQNTGNFADAELAWTSFDKGVKLYKHLWNGMSRERNRTDEGKTRVHPTQKPVGLLQKILNDFTEKGDVVLDVFGGSGSTLIACEGTERKCLMIEMSENYCDIIRRRYTKWAKENGKPITSGCLE